MRRRFRDVAAALAVLIAVAGILTLIDTRFMERVEQVTGQVQSQGVSSSGSSIGDAAHGALAMTSRSAQSNPVLFSFAIVAAMLFLLMLRVL